MIDVSNRIAAYTGIAVAIVGSFWELDSLSYLTGLLRRLKLNQIEVLFSTNG